MRFVMYFRVLTALCIAKCGREFNPSHSVGFGPFLKRFSRGHLTLGLLYRQHNVFGRRGVQDLLGGLAQRIR